MLPLPRRAAHPSDAHRLPDPFPSWAGARAPGLPRASPGSARRHGQPAGTPGRPARAPGLRHPPGRPGPTARAHRLRRRPLPCALLVPGRPHQFLLATPLRPVALGRGLHPAPPGQGLPPGRRPPRRLGALARPSPAAGPGRRTRRAAGLRRPGQRPPPTAAMVPRTPGPLRPRPPPGRLRDGTGRLLRHGAAGPQRMPRRRGQPATVRSGFERLPAGQRTPARGRGGTLRPGQGGALLRRRGRTRRAAALRPGQPRPHRGHGPGGPGGRDRAPPAGAPGPGPARPGQGRPGPAQGAGRRRGPGPGALPPQPGRPMRRAQPQSWPRASRWPWPTTTGTWPWP